jgi:hypothetical protein
MAEISEIVPKKSVESSREDLKGFPKKQVSFVF